MKDLIRKAKMNKSSWSQKIKSFKETDIFDQAIPTIQCNKNQS